MYFYLQTSQLLSGKAFNSMSDILHFEVGNVSDMKTAVKIIKTVFMPGQKKRKKVYGQHEGKRGKRENLVAGRRKKEKDVIAPIIFKGSLNAVGFEQWYDQHLLPLLKNPSVLLHG